jgi:hypothetical protein
MGTRIRFEPVRDGTRWRVLPEDRDAEGHMPFKVRYAAEDDDVEGHGRRFYFSLEPDGEGEGGEPLFRLEGDDAEGHMPRIRTGFSLEPTDEEEDGVPVYRVEAEGDDAEGHAYKSGR